MNKELKEQTHKEFDEYFYIENNDWDKEDMGTPSPTSVKSFIDSLIDKTVQMTEERIVGIVEEIEAPIFEGASGFDYNSGWNDGEKSGQYNLKEEIISLITNKSDINNNKE